MDMWFDKIHFLKKAKIRKQLYTTYFVAVFLPITIIGTFLLVNTSRLLTNYHRDLLESDNLRVKTILFEITTKISNISEDLAFDESIKDVISSLHYVRSIVTEKANNIKSIDHYDNKYAEIDSIQIYTDNPTFVDYKQFLKADDEIQATDWYQKAISQSSILWVPMKSTDKYGNDYWNLCLVRKIPLVDSKYKGVLVIRVSDNYLKVRINSLEYESMVSVDEGPVFYSTSREVYGKPQAVAIDYDEGFYHSFGDLKIGGTTYFVNVSTLQLSQSDSRIYIANMNGQAHSNIRSIINVCILIIAVAILIPGVMILYFTKYFTSRVLTLRQAMHQASNEDYELMESVTGEDELSEAFSDLEVMIQRIKKKDADMYEALINEQELINEQQVMEYKMLASQINPHFLYNTLETIRMKAFTAGDKEVATAIKLLGKSMRYVLENTGTAFTTLGRELEHVEVYLAIQKLRFGEKFDSKFLIEEGVDTEELYILPLLLQPIVENAILHGLEEKEAGGIVEIMLHIEGEILVIGVTDNGCGMEEETKAALRESIEVKDRSRSKSIGLYSINQRIKLNYGQDFGMDIESQVGEGTTISFGLPLAKMQGNPILENKN